jgi:hypothetical protein
MYIGNKYEFAGKVMCSYVFLIKRFRTRVIAIGKNMFTKAANEIGKTEFSTVCTKAI